MFSPHFFQTLLKKKFGLQKKIGHPKKRFFYAKISFTKMDPINIIKKTFLTEKRERKNLISPLGSFLFMAMVILSALVKRFSVSRMWDFCWPTVMFLNGFTMFYKHKHKHYHWLDIYQFPQQCPYESLVTKHYFGMWHL